MVERFWAKVEQCQRVVTRHDKPDPRYPGVVQLAAITVVRRNP